MYKIARTQAFIPEILVKEGYYENESLGFAFRSKIDWKYIIEMVRIAKLAWDRFSFRSKNRLKRYDRDGFLGFGLFPIKNAPGQSIYYYSPAYLFQLIPENNTPYTTRSVQKKCSD